MAASEPQHPTCKLKILKLRKAQKITDRFGFIFWIHSASKNPYIARFARIFFLDLIQHLFPNHNIYLFPVPKQSLSSGGKC